MQNNQIPKLNIRNLDFEILLDELDELEIR
jgi:hypothetical protein